MKPPLSVYDVFGYLTSGFVVLAASDVAFAQGWLAKGELPLLQGVAILVFTYVVGHAVAHLSSALLQDGLVHKLLGRPENVLFGSRRRGLVRSIFPGFFRPLPQQIRDAVMARAGACGIGSVGQGLFMHCHAIVVREETIRQRLDVFLTLYGFARNLCLAALLSGGVLAIGAFREARAGSPTAYGERLVWASVFVLVAVIMLYRYLKFYRRYTSEVFRAYAVGDREKAGV